MFNRISWCFVYLILFSFGFFGLHQKSPDIFDPGARPKGRGRRKISSENTRSYVNIDAQHQMIQQKQKNYIINIYICSKNMGKNKAGVFLSFFRVNDYSSTQWPSDHGDVSLRFSFRSPGERRKRLQLPWKLSHNRMLIQKSSHVARQKLHIESYIFIS